MIDSLRSLGIEKGKPFAPDAKMNQAMKDGVTDAHAWMAAKYDGGFPPFYEGTRWTFPAHPELIKAATEDFEGANDYPVDWRGITYHYAYIGIKRLGAGQFYLINIKDKGGADYDGAKSYRLQCSRGRSHRAVLVAHRIRPRYPRPHQERRRRQPRVEQHGSEEERRRFGRPLCRREGASWSGTELDSN